MASTSTFGSTTTRPALSTGTRLGIYASAFNPLHPGHIWACTQAINDGCCDAILAALHIDPSIANPAKRRPVMTVQERLIMLRCLRFVDEVVVYEDEDSLQSMINYIRPAVIIVGEDHRDDYVTGSEYAPVFYARRLPEWSSSAFMDRFYQAERARREQASQGAPPTGDQGTAGPLSSERVRDLRGA